MLIEVEVTGGANSPLDLHRMFDLLTDPIEVMRVYSTSPNGEDLWCSVTGWSSDGECTAMSALAEDSGEGVVLLVYGGDEDSDCSQQNQVTTGTYQTRLNGEKHV